MAFPSALYAAGELEKDLCHLGLQAFLKTPQLHIPTDALKNEAETRLILRIEAIRGTLPAILLPLDISALRMRAKKKCFDEGQLAIDQHPGKIRIFVRSDAAFLFAEFEAADLGIAESEVGRTQGSQQPSYTSSSHEGGTADHRIQCSPGDDA